jgi:hypothetical protein
MRGLMDHRRGLLATVTGIAAGLAGGLLIAGCGPLADPGSPSNPAEAANAPPSVSNSDRPDQAGPSSSPSGPDPAPVPGRSSRPSRPEDSPSTSAGAYADAPSDNLRRLASALQFRYKSTTAVLRVPAGLDLTAAVEISVLWDEAGTRPTRATQDYNNATGNRSLFFFPAEDGRTRPVANVVSLAERQADGEISGTYAVRSNVSIKPLYDIAVTPLTFTLQLDCDTVGASEIHIRWFYPDGGRGIHEVSTFEGESYAIAAFGRTYREVDASTLRVPAIVFYEVDVAAGFHGFPDANGQPLLPGTDRAVDVMAYARNDPQCGARLQFGVTLRLREYPYLD